VSTSAGIEASARIVDEMMAATPARSTARAVTTALALVAALGALDAMGERGPRRSTSRGNPNDGSLQDAARLPTSGPGYLSNPARPNAEAIYGTDEMIGALTSAGAAVEARAPGARLFVNDLSFREGGTISQHASHESGRDADLLFYSFDAAGAVADPLCIPFGDDGTARVSRRASKGSVAEEARVFDDRRNWLVVRSLVENAEAKVQRIFVAETLRSRLLAHAAESGEPAWIVERAGDLMCEPETPHDDHFHVRLFCTADDYRQGCRDGWPLYPWYRTELAALGLTDPQLRPPLPSRPRRRARADPARPPRPRPGRLWCP
jgi:penicillin-insensitive murein endopeptidase